MKVLAPSQPLGVTNAISPAPVQAEVVGTCRGEREATAIGRPHGTPLIGGIEGPPRQLVSCPVVQPDVVLTALVGDVQCQGDPSGENCGLFQIAEVARRSVVLPSRSIQCTASCSSPCSGT